MQTKIKKILSSLMVIIMLMAHMSTLGINLGEVIASSNLNAQDTFTNNANVQCDVYFVDGEHFTHEATKNVGEENLIAIGVSVSETGYLKDAKVEFNDSNFVLSGKIDSDKVAKANENTLYLNQVNAGDVAVIYVPFALKHDETFSLSDFSKVSSAKFTGTYLDGKGKERAIQKEIKLGLAWTADAKSEITAEVSKYVKYDVNDEQGVTLQVIAKEKVINNILPIKESNLEIQAPQINNVMPVNTTIYSPNSDYEASYNKDTGVINIVVKNEENEQGQVNWNEVFEREYEINYQYPKTAITDEEVVTKISMKTNTKVYASQEKTIEGKLENEVKLKDQIGEIVDLKEEVTDRISKGYMFANLISENKIETPYIDKITTDISIQSLVDSITYYLNKDSIMIGEKEYEANTHYTKIRFSKDIIKEFFGDEGSISIYAGEELVAKIDKTTEDKDESIKLDADNLTIITTKPVKAGRFTFEVEKAIKGDSKLDEAQIGAAVSINTNRIVTSEGSEIVVSEKKVKNEIKLIDPKLKADLVLSNPNVLTEETNDNVEIKVVLRTDSEYNKLYKDPTVIIEIPEHIEQMNITSAQVLFDDELKVKACNIEGRKIITELEGTQTKYNMGSGISGTTIVFQANLKAKELTPKITEPLTMTVISKDEQIQAIADVNFIAPTGIVTINKITNIDNGQDLVALKEDEETTIEAKAEAKNVTEEIRIINNNDNEIKNVTILGRTLGTGTTDTDTGEKLDNTLDVPMISGINTNGLEGAVVYYSENGEATKDLDNPENGWKEEVADVTKVKSYLIKLDENASMKIGDSATFTYDMQIPENIDYDKESKSAYTVFFDNVKDDQSIPEKATSKRLSVGTAGTPTLEVSLSSYSPEHSIIRNGQIVKYTATISNTGSVDAENVRLSLYAPKETMYYYIEEDEEEIGDNTGNIDEDDEIDNEIIEGVEVNDIEGRVYTTDRSVIDSYNHTGYAYEYTMSHVLLDENKTNLGYHLLSTRSDGKDDSTVDLSDFLTAEEEAVERDYDIRERIIEVGQLKAGESIDIEYELQVTDYQVDEYDNEIVAKAKASVIADEMSEAVESNEYSLKIEDSLLDVLVTRDRVELNSLTAGMDITYDVYITSRVPNRELSNVIARFDLPDGLKIVSAAYEGFAGEVLEGQTEDEAAPTCLMSLSNNNRRLNASISKLNSSDTIILRIHTRATDNVGDITATAYATVEEKVHQGNYIDNRIEELDYDLIQKEPDNVYIKEDETITIEYNLINNSNISCPTFSFKNIIPDNMKIVSIKSVADTDEDQDDLVTYSIVPNTDEENPTDIEISTELDAHQTQKIFVTLKAGFLPDGVTEKRVENYATSFLEDKNVKTSNVVTLIIERNPNANRPIGDDEDGDGIPDDEQGGSSGTEDPDDTTNGMKISGVAWADENADGARNDSEELLQNITVYLLDNSTKEIIKKTATDANGEYLFNRLEAGEYNVAFEYDTSKYTLTQYQKSGVALSVNSDAIETTMKIDGTSKKVGITDTLKITESNIRNVDIGLLTANKSNVTLQKYISAVTLSYGSTVKNYSYDQLKLAKVEVPANQLSKATIIVEYKIVVKNEGSIANYVKKIVDYIPSGMTFNSELNKDWYKSTSGDLYNSSLANTKLNPGESKEVTLTLTKALTDSSTGVVNNNAEIYELYNEQGVDSTTSTPGNKKSGENDMSSADLVISVKTGDAVVYSILISLVIILILGVGVYFIRQYLLKGIERGVL